MDRAAASSAADVSAGDVGVELVTLADGTLVVDVVFDDNTADAAVVCIRADADAATTEADPAE